MKALQKLASIHANIFNHFSLQRPNPSKDRKERRSAAMAELQNVVSQEAVFKDSSASL
jgi:putative transposase